MKISRDNYEIWFLDYYEGHLSLQQVEELKIFLEFHFDLKEEFERFENISLPPAKKIIFDAKESLKKLIITTERSINEKNYEDFFIADIEGELTKEQKNELTLFIEKNPQLKKELELFHKTKNTPDDSIKFPAKEILKKNEIIPVGSVNDKNYAEYFIAAMENDLKLDQLNDLKVFLNKNPQLLKESNLFGQTRLAVDTAIFFNRKQQLKQPVIPAKAFTLKKTYYPVSIAASVIILIAIYFLFNKAEIISIKTASRNNINLHRNIQKKAVLPVIIDNSANKQYFAYSKSVNQDNGKLKNTNQNVIKNYAGHDDFQFLAALKPKMIPQNNEDENNFAERTFVEDQYAMLQKSTEQAEEEKKDNKKYISLKDFALYKLKRSIAPKNKKDKISPTDNKITLWDIADAGISKISNLTGAKAKFDHNKNNGSFTFALGNNFEISRNKRSQK